MQQERWGHFMSIMIKMEVREIIIPGMPTFRTLFRRETPGPVGAGIATMEFGQGSSTSIESQAMADWPLDFASS